MPGLLKNVPVSDEQRRANDQHRPAVVLAVLALLGVYIYLFTQAAVPLGLPLPAELASDLGIEIRNVFDSDGNVESNVGISMTDRLQRSDDERLVFFLTVIGAFLCAYFLPLRLKQPSLVLWTLLALWILFGPRVTAGLLLVHLCLYLVLHPHPKRNLSISAAAGLLGYVGFVHEAGGGAARLALIGVLPVGAALLYRHAVLPLSESPRLGPLLRTAVVQSAILTISVGVFVEGIGGKTWALPLAIAMFFWQWPRITMYHIDYKDGLVPRDLSVDRYLAVFFNPGVIPKWSWGVTIPQAYAYLNNNFLCENKNKLVLSGVRLLGVALLYLVLWNWLRLSIADFFGDLGIPAHRGHTRRLVEHFARGGAVSTPTVLVTTLLDLLRFMLFFGSVMHFKVGIWRIFGYRIDAYYNRPWLATNLVSLWGRFAFHYREFLVRAFYYPVLLRFFKGYPALRVFAASMAAAAAGNLIWHFEERVLFRELTVDNILYVVGTWPYFLLLGLGIASYQLFRMRRKATRAPWTRGWRIVLDVLAAYCTLQFFAMIHIFARPVPESSVADLFRLFLIGLGIHLPG